jgi:hypothetical protein
MKNILSLASVCLIVILAACNNSGKKSNNNEVNTLADTGTGKIVFKEYEHAFGEVAQGEKISYTFTFQNTGTGNLILKSAKTTCGCTVPKYDKEPIRPGETGNIEVVFDTTDRSGMQTKTITVESNASVPVVILKITAVVKQEEK